MKEVVYHGTASNNLEELINEIVTNGFVYKYRDNHWLGQGIYFFDKYEWAERWAKQPINFNKDKCVFSARIFCRDNEFLDLDSVKVQYKVSEYIKKINDEIYLKSNEIFFNDDINKRRCFYLDIIKKEYNYKILKHSFVIDNNNDITRDIGLNVVQIQYCVSDNTCIFDASVLKKIPAVKRKKLNIK